MTDGFVRSQARVDFFQRLMDFHAQALLSRHLPQLDEDELHVLQDFLWATHQDVVMEWSRRDMMRRSPVDPGSYR